MNVLVDTCILIDFLNGFEESKLVLKKYMRPAISIITWAEILTGANSEAEESELRLFLQGFNTINLDESISLTAARLKRQTKIKLPDALILASAQAINAALITRNSKDFSRFSDVIIPYILNHPKGKC